MISNRIIICIASSWEFDPTSKHQVMKRLAHDNHILWVNYHGSSTPTLNKQDRYAITQKLKQVMRGVTPIAPTMWQTTPLVWPGAPIGWRSQLSDSLLIAQIRRALRTIPGYPHKPIQVWSFAPDVCSLPGQFNEERFVYYCVDEHSEFAGYDRQRILQREHSLVAQADVVITTSHALCEARRQWRSDVHLVRHGVDHAHFARAWQEPLPPPADIADLQGPIFGFFGLLQHWIDIPLLEHLATQRPQYSFVLIGDAQTDVARLRHLPNVRLLGRKPYAELPNYCRHFTAGLIPFAVTNMTIHVNPIKLLEYLAAGLPVIATPLPEVQRIASHVTVCPDAPSFVAACDTLANQPPTAQQRQAISATVQDAGWPAIVERLSHLVMQGRSPAPSLSTTPHPAPLLST